MKSSNTLILAIVAVAIAGASFYGGMLYQKSKQPASTRDFFAQRMGGDASGMPTGQTGMRRNFGSGAQMAAGEVISKDDTSVTLKLQDGGSKIILLASSTNIGKMAEGTADDLAEGTNVVVTGSSNTDGSMTANMIQIRPEGDAPGMPGGIMRFDAPPQEDQQGE
jgi:hypothetical protein